MSSLYNPTIEAWLLEHTEVSLKSVVRLSGEESLYEGFENYCQSQRVPPPRLQEFSRGVEFLMGHHFHITSPKVRRRRGMVFRGIQLKTSNPLIMV